MLPDTETITADLDASTDDLCRQMARLSAEAFNHKAALQQWSAAQVAEHLLILEKIAYKALTGNTVPTTRPPDSKLPLIKMAMEDRSTKRTAPEAASPSATWHEPADTIKRFSSEREALKNIIRTTDLSAACTGFKHPALGTLTRLEWVYFIIYHTARHTGQIAELINRNSEGNASL